MAKYASATNVSAEKSRAEIESTLKAYGATGYGYAWQGDYAVVVFEFKGRRMKFILPIPDVEDVSRTQTGRIRNRRAVPGNLDLETRRRWRSLFLSIKAKLVTVSDGISTVETEFMGHIVLPNGMTVSEWMTPQIEDAYKSGSMPPFLIEEPK